MELFPAVPHGELWTFVAGLLLAGVAAGLIAGLLGVGGGIVVVPVLYHALAGLGVEESVRMHVAVATSLATIVPTSLASLTTHRRHGAVDADLLRRWAGPMALGVVAGAAVAGFISSRGLALFFALVALPVAAHMAFSRESWRIRDGVPGGVAGAGAAGAIGGLSAMMGIGGGTFGTILMTLCGVPIHHAVGTSSGFGVIISIPGAIGFAVAGWSLANLPPYSLGYVNLIGFALIAPATVLLAPVGARLAHAVSKTKLRRLFALFIAITAARMLYDALA